MAYRFYPDVFWVTNFIMDFFVLFLIRFFQKYKNPVKRIILSAAFGASGSVAWFLLLSDYQFYQILIHLIWNPMMLWIAFSNDRKLHCNSYYKKNDTQIRTFLFREKIYRFLKDLFMSYIMMALLGGIINWGFAIVSSFQYFWLWGISGFGICMLVIYGLEVRKLERLCYDILLQTEKETLLLKGFLDTGNLLSDPLIHKPVHIIQEDLLEEILKKEEVPVRYIPFHSLGQEQGILPVVTLKGMYVRNIQEKATAPVYIEKPVLGLAKEKLFQRKDYQIILNARNL